MKKYINNGDGTITDRVTGLMWKRCCEGQEWKRSGKAFTGETGEYTYEQAMSLKSDFAGHSDWRMPTIDELKTIIKSRKSSSKKPCINRKVFPDNPNLVWSSSPYLGNPSLAQFVRFSYGDVFSNYRHNTFAVRLVRMVK